MCAFTMNFFVIALYLVAIKAVDLWASPSNATEQGSYGREPLGV